MGSVFAQFDREDLETSPPFDFVADLALSSSWIQGRERVVQCLSPIGDVGVRDRRRTTFN